MRTPTAWCRSVSWVAALAAVVLGLAGCSGDALVDERNIYYIRGMKLREQKNHEEAAAAFETCLRLSPQSAQAHLQLALLYDEPLNDPLVAVYHYRRFLEMRPDDPNAEVAKEWAAKTEQKLLQRLQQAAVYAAISQGGGAAPLPESAGASTRELALLARVQELTAANEELRKRLEEPVIDPTLLPPASSAPAAAAPTVIPSTPVAAAPAAVAPAVETPPATPAAPGASGMASPAVAAPSPGLGVAARPTGGTPPSPAGAARTHVVAQGDTLSNLSRRYYGAMSYWPQLKQANRDILGDKEDLKLGMRLRIPPLDQLRAPAAPSVRQGR